MPESAPPQPSEPSRRDHELEARSPRGPIFFFDGRCGRCQRSVRALLALGAGRALSFAPLGGKTAERIGHPSMTAGADSSVLYEPGAPPSISLRTCAALRVLGYLPRPLCWIAKLSALPGLCCALDPIYTWFAQRRGRVDPLVCDPSHPADPRLWP